MVATLPETPALRVLRQFIVLLFSVNTTIFFGSDMFGTVAGNVEKRVDLEYMYIYSIKR